jgi:predicted transcriptional regulator
MNNNLISFEFVSKLKKRFKNMIKKSIKNLDIDNFLEHITRYTNYTWNDIDELGTEKMIDNLFKNNMIDKLLNNYNIGFDDFLTYFNVKNDELSKEAEEFLESVINWDDIYEKLLIEIDEDDYFKYLPSLI